MDYNNINWKRSWVIQDEPSQTTSKAEIHKKKKIIIILYCQSTGIIKEFCPFELLTNNQTTNSNVYFQRFSKLSDAIQAKRPDEANRSSVIFHYDNAKFHTSLLLAKNDLIWVGMCCDIRHIGLTLRLQTDIYFVSRRTP